MKTTSLLIASGDAYAPSKRIANPLEHTGGHRELMPSEILYTDSTDYLLGGALTLKNGRIDMYQFDEGYCQATQYNATQDNFTFQYLMRNS